MSPAVPYITPSTAAAARRFAVIASVIVGALALITILGWILGVDAMTGGPGATPEVKLNAGLALLALAGAALLTAHGGRTGTAAMALAVFAGLVGAFTFAQYVTGIDLRIDQLLIDDHLGADTRHPGRMAPLSALALVALSLALLMRGQGRALRIAQQGLAVLPFVFGLLGAVGLLYGFRFLTGMSLHLAGMSPFTAVALMLLSAAILALDVDTGLMRLVLSNRTGGRFVRAMLPVAILFPVITGWARMYGEMVGYFDNHFGLLVMVLSAIFVYSLIAVLSAHRLNQAEDKLLEAQQTLARRVQERTHDLEVTVANLRAESELRAAAEQSRAQSQATLRSALEHAPIGMAIVGLNGRFMQVNRSLCDIVGRDESELLRCSFQDITHPDDLDKDLALVGSLVRGEIPHYQMEKRYVRANAEPVWVMLSVSLVRDAAGNPAFFVSQVEDISLRREAEREVAASRQFLGDIVNSIPIPLTVKDDTGRILVANTAMARFHGGSADDLVGKTDFDLFPAPRARTFQSEDEALLRSGVPFSQEQAFDAISGERRWVIKHKHRIVLSDGNRCVLTTLLDITDRKKAELALRDSEERFRSLTALSADWYWEQDENLRFTMQSGGVLQTLNVTAEEIIGKARWEIPYTDMTEEDWRRHRETLEDHLPFRDFELTRRFDDGSTRHVSLSGEPIFDAEGRFRGYRGTGRDITARRSMELELAQSRQFLGDVINFIPLPLVVKDETGRVVIVNSAMESFQNRPASELAGKRDDEVFPDDRASLLQAEDEAVLRTGVPLREEQRFVTAAGEARWVIKHKQRLVQPDGTRLVIATLMDITERKEAELELARSRGFLDAVMDAIPQPLFVKDDQHRWVLLNSAFCDLLGRDRRELLGNSDPSFYPDDWVARVWAEDDQVLIGNGSVVVEEISEPRPDGSARWMLKSKKRVDLPDGSRVIVGISADISRLKEVEEALRKSEALHRLLADNSSDLISLLTPTGAIEYASPASVAVLGRRPDELTGMPVTELIHPDDQERALQVFKEAVKFQAHAVFTCRLKRSDGSWSWIETSFRAIVDNDTGLTRQIIGVSRDVNERVRVTDALNHFKYVLDNTLDMIFIYDADTLRFNYVNEGAVRTLGYPRERLLGMTPWQVRADIEEKDYPRSIKPFLEGRVTSRQLESVHRRADGSLIPVEVTMQLVRRPGEVGTFIAIARDLTERKKVEQMKNEFISTVSHELRTPVTSIRGSLGLLAGGVAGRLPKQAKELIDIANNNSERLIRLINDILDIEKIESGKMRFSMGPVQLPELLHEALREVQGYAARFNVSLRIEGEVPEVTVRADRDRILQVLANLLSNAAKFSPPGAEVLASAQARSASVRVFVTDHGSGIPPEFHDKIFGKFLQADASDSREKGGTGLGLSIAKAIVEKHGGEIGFHTAQGEGTTFYFDLPLMFSATQAPGDAQAASGSIH